MPLNQTKSFDHLLCVNVIKIMLSFINGIIQQPQKMPNNIIRIYFPIIGISLGSALLKNIIKNLCLSK